jgi:hypothetical protein
MPSPGVPARAGGDQYCKSARDLPGEDWLDPELAKAVAAIAAELHAANGLRAGPNLPELFGSTELRRRLGTVAPLLERRILYSG